MFPRFIIKNYFKVVKVEPIVGGNHSIITLKESINIHFSSPHIGSEILSMSQKKRPLQRSDLSSVPGLQGSATEPVYRRLVVHFREFGLLGPAERADPVFGQAIESGSGSYAVIFIAFGRVVDVATYVTYVFLHAITSVDAHLGGLSVLLPGGDFFIQLV